LGDEPGSLENKILVLASDEILPEPPAHGKLEAGTKQHEEAEGLCGFLFL
jgi:hypothetical protein